MKRLRILRRWFARKFGYARLICLALLIGFAALRIADPAPVEELRVRTFDTFQRIDPRVKTATAGHHRRYRRKEPGQTRPVALAADADRRHGHQPDQARRRRDRLRHRVLGARPAQSRRRRRHLALSRRGNPQQAAGSCRATIRFSPMRSSARAWCWAKPDLPRIRLGTRQDASGDRARHARRGPAALHVQVSRACCATSRCWKRRPAGRGLLTIKPERDGIVRRVPMMLLAQGTHHAVAELRNVAGGDGHRHHLHQVRPGRYQERRRQGLRGSDRPQRPALGAFRAARSLDLCFGSRRARRQRCAREDQGQAGADRNLGGRTERHQDDAGRPGDARRRNPRPGARERADPCGAGAAVLRHRAGILCRADARASGDRVRADVRAGHPGRGRRAVCHRF